MRVYAFTSSDGTVGALVECPQEQIDIQPYNTQFPLRFDITDKLGSVAQTDYLRVIPSTGELQEMPPPSEPAPTLQELDAQARSLRSDLLASTDWTQLPDVPQETKDLWASYRQALRDITEQPDYPTNIIWPTPPQ